MMRIHMAQRKKKGTLNQDNWESVAVRMPKWLLNRIDEICRKEMYPNRAHLLRRLLVQGLEVETGEEVKEQ